MEWIILLIVVAGAFDWLFGGSSNSESRATTPGPRIQNIEPRPRDAVVIPKRPTRVHTPNRPESRVTPTRSPDATRREPKPSDRSEWQDTSTADQQLELSPQSVEPLASTTQLGRIIGVKAKPFLFDALIEGGHLARTDGRYCLTGLGCSVGGRYRSADDGSDYVIWPKGFGKSLQPIKERLLEEIPFRLFHMTHINNLHSILTTGLHAHATAPQYRDISNREVNDRRARTDPVHRLPLHHYVPLYFNPRNAMLYEKQREYGNDIVILEFSRSVCLQEYTLFSERNAATNTARFEYCPSALAAFDWTQIHARKWVYDRVTHVEVKQLMMSECLVHGRIDAKRIAAVHTMNKPSELTECSAMNTCDGPPVRISPNLFF